MKHLSIYSPFISRRTALWKLPLTLISLMSLALIGCESGSEGSEASAGGFAGEVAGEVGGGALAGEQAGESAGESGAGESGAGESAGELGAGESAGTVGGETSAPCQTLEPDAAEAAQRVISERCGLCHGATPQYGAPYSLVDVEELTTTPEGIAQLERAVERILEGTMPPAGQPSLSADEAQAIIDWATCGEGGDYVAPPGGFQVDRPVYQSLPDIPEGTMSSEFVAPQVMVSPDQEDDYQCFAFHGPQGEAMTSAARSIIRFEPVIDDARVVHHIVLYETDRDVEDGMPVSCGAGLGAAVYAWAPGQDPLHFREGGLVSSSDKRYVLEIHYNNSARLSDVVDSSGVRVYHSEPIEPAIDMMTFGPDGFILPARQRTEVVGDCVIDEELEVIAMMPHMHEIGVDFHSQILRDGDESWEEFINLTSWDFNAQLVYEGEGTRLNAGDRVRTRCVFNNEGDTARAYGPFTEDEMCYHFVYVTPPPTERRCNVAVQDLDGSYPVGGCAPDSLERHERSISGRYFEGRPVELVGGILPRGDFTLVGLEMWFPSYDLGIAVLDPDLSSFEAAGAFQLDDTGAFALDLQGEINLVSARGAQFMRALNVSFSGQLEQAREGSPDLSAEISCPDTATISLSFEPSIEDQEPGTFILHLPFSEPVEGVQVMRFAPR